LLSHTWPEPQILVLQGSTKHITGGLPGGHALLLLLPLPPPLLLLLAGAAAFGLHTALQPPQ
jgi:hypothetical protein